MRTTARLELEGHDFNEEIFSTEHEMFRETARRFIQKELEPHYLEWEHTEIGYPREIWQKAADAGLVGLAIPEAYGGPGADLLFKMILAEEMGKSVAGVSTGATLFSADLMTSMLVEHGTEEQKQRYCPGILAGTTISCAGISEPAAGSDVNAMQTRARRDGSDYLISGQKVYISNGMHADLCYLVARTDEDIERGRGALTMFLVDMNTSGMERQRMSTLGERAGSVAELFMEDMRVPETAILGKPGMALRENLAFLFTADRVGLALRAISVCRLAYDLTVQHTSERRVFGRRVIDFGNSRAKLASIRADIEVMEGFKDTLLRQFKAGLLDPLTSSSAKYWICSKEFEIANECLQLHGGYGYITESPISRIFTFARLETIYAGTNEIQLGTIGRLI
ncbi:acyl-CoA dehydrogenase family protein [Sphingobium sp. EM0848]|uniref:acyl-CoA dehydrogenase family protein n=1 Tax=Sphingobium sp. EM0848 TaxID=2743473 RepID=UPI00159C6530|nr:acyl-CoA dehydrogenase family protein [Sphingobium sp. EM0848]